MAESYGREMLGDANWMVKLFETEESDDCTTKGYLMPAEFAMIAAKLNRELGDQKAFKFNFQEADSNLNGRVDLAEWSAYCTKLEAVLGKRRCLKAVHRYLGTSRAENRPKLILKECPAGLYVFHGFNADASLQLVRTCNRWSDPNLVERVRSYLEAGADPNCGLGDAMFHGYTPLIFLAMAKPPPNRRAEIRTQVTEAIHLLVENKADPHRTCERMPFGEWAPLRFAAQLQSRPGVEALLTYVDIGDRMSWAAGENVQHVMLQELRKVWASYAVDIVESRNNFSNAATVLMIRYSSPVMPGTLTASGARKLIEGRMDDETVLESGQCADPDGCGLEGITALMNMVMTGNVEAVQALLECRADPMRVDSSGSTALHMAAARLDVQSTQALLACRADPSAQDHVGFSPWMLVGEVVEVCGDEEKARTSDLLGRLRPKRSADSLLEMNWWELFISVCPPVAGKKYKAEEIQERLSKTLRLQEALFFNDQVVRRRALESRHLRDDLLQKASRMIIGLMNSDPLVGDKKALTKYLLGATMGPQPYMECSHIRVPWRHPDNRASYKEDLAECVDGLMRGFAEECGQIRGFILDYAQEDPSGSCAKLLALPEDEVAVPLSLQNRHGFWRDVQERQLLRFDPPWARKIRDGSSLCKALLRLRAVDDLDAYVRLQQVEHASFEEMVARGYVKYSDICNEAFQVKLMGIVKKFAQKEGLELQPPEKLVPAKKLKRLLEKTVDARKKHAGKPWTGLPDEYRKFSSCFHILDTVRLAFTCCGSADRPAKPEQRSLSWTAVQTPTTVEALEGEETKADSFNFDGLSKPSGQPYVAPERRGSVPAEAETQLALVLDLGEAKSVDRLEIINACGEKMEHYILDYEVGIGNDATFIRTKPGSFPKVSTTAVQDAYVGGMGRYIKFVMKPNGQRSPGLAYLNVVEADDDEVVEDRKREHVQDQVRSCMKLLEKLRSLTLEKDRICVLRRKSGFDDICAAEPPEKTGGYADVKLLCLADLGTYTAFDGALIPLKIVGEVQLILQSYKEVKDRMHLAYEVARASFGKICD